MTFSRDDDAAYLQVYAGDHDDAEELAALTALLREDLLDLDVAAVEPVYERSPDGSKGVAAAVAGWLVVHFGPAGLKALVNAVAAWAGRTGKTVELTIGGNSLKLTGSTAELQSKIVEEFFARQPPIS